MALHAVCVLYVQHTVTVRNLTVSFRSVRFGCRNGDLHAPQSDLEIWHSPSSLFPQAPLPAADKLQQMRGVPIYHALTCAVAHLPDIPR